MFTVTMKPKAKQSINNAKHECKVLSAVGLMYARTYTKGLAVLAKETAINANAAIIKASHR